jgi:hypothetical protein
MARALNLGVQCRTGPVLEPTAACGPSCEVRPGRLPMPAVKPSSNRSLEVLKQQRAMRQFRTRELDRVGNEFTLATMAFNITRLYGLRTA